MATSRLPSPLKLPTAIADGVSPVVGSSRAAPAAGASKVPSPVPRWTPSGATMSRMPLLVKSPTAIGWNMPYLEVGRKLHGLTRVGRRRQRRREREVPEPEALHFNEFGAGRDVLVDRGPLTAGRLSVALDEQVALAVVQRQPELKRAGIGQGLDDKRPSTPGSICVNLNAARGDFRRLVADPSVSRSFIALLITDAGSTRGALAEGLAGPEIVERGLQATSYKATRTRGPSEHVSRRLEASSGQSNRPAEKHGRSPSVAASSRTIVSLTRATTCW